MLHKKGHHYSLFSPSKLLGSVQCLLLTWQTTTLNTLFTILQVIYFRCNLRGLLIEHSKSLAMRHITLEDGANFRCFPILKYPDCAIFGEEEIHLFECFAGRFLYKFVG